ncbi:MAG: hypothetical protein COT43_05240 [Candidatus Marinimicrobia bacterium CG08_land_8_20_14_0_20_45_22]|nr:MAG: hypothetical protein COT43_05240 [Candidatus Marinimicrobia bacterium CG08_land_8_20_14_0_20_45_22]
MVVVFKKKNLLDFVQLRFIFSLLFAMPAFVKSQTPATDQIYISASNTMIQLSHRFIIPSSIHVNTENALTDSIIVGNLNAKNGTLRIGTKLPDSTIVRISYKYLDAHFPYQGILNLPPRLYIPTSQQKVDIQPLQQESRLKTSTEYDFLKSGTIYRGVTLRSESGLSLQSGLNLELQGNLSDDISVIGTLTDRNLPIQPEGNTQALDEIDKVFITVNMPKEKVTFGDYELSLTNGQFGSYSRKLQGMIAESKRGILQTKIAGAVSKGEYYSNYFLGQEGNQGPYPLTGKNGETAIIILAGTEKVWIDGKAMSRGENSDYVIDYSTAEIMFTARQLITSDSRITVDFQYSDLIYQNNIWLAQTSVSGFSNRLHLSAEMINESADKDNPIDMTLSEAEKKTLREAGDLESIAFRSTIVTDSSGSYILSDSILIFVGSGNGTHTAAFYLIGKSGQYRKRYTADLIYYEWVNKSDPNLSESVKEEAVYSPVKPLKMPEKQRLFHLSSDWQPSKFFNLKTEFARSSLDKNTFSRYDDNDNFGNAMSVSANLLLPTEKFGKIDLTGKLLNQEKRFNPIDRNQEVEYFRKWNLPSDSTSGQQMVEGKMTWQVKDRFTVGFDGGQLTLDSLKSARYKANGSIRYGILENGSISHEEIRSSTHHIFATDWIRQRASVQFKIRGFRPYAEYYSENLVNDSSENVSFRFETKSIGLISPEAKKLRWKIERFTRTDDKRDSGWVKNSEAENLIFSGELLDWKTLSAKWDITHRNKKYYRDNSIPNADFYLLSAMVQQNPRNFPVRWETNMKIEEERTVKKERRYYYVGVGKGDYLYDSTFADYVPHAQGDYILRILPTDIKEPVTSIQNGVRLQFFGNVLRNRFANMVFTRMTAVTDFRLDQQIRKEQGSLGLWTFRTAPVDTNWAYFNRSIQQDISYRLKKIHGDFRFRVQQTDQISQLDVRGKENTQNSETSLRYKGQFLKNTTIDATLSEKQLIRKSEISSTRERNIQTLAFQSKISRLWSRIHLIDGDLTFNRDRGTSGDPVVALLTQTKFGYERKVAGKGRWRVFSEIDQMKVTPKDTAIPWEMGSGRREGWTIGWGATFEYQIGKNVSLRAVYEGWNEPDRDVYHVGSGEIRAMF